MSNLCTKLLAPETCVIRKLRLRRPRARWVMGSPWFLRRVFDELLIGIESKWGNNRDER